MKVPFLTTALAASMVILTGCGAEQKQSTPPAHAAMPVTVLEARPVELASNALIMGQIKSSSVIEMRAKVSGYLAKRNAVDGQHVKRGDVLFELDETDFKLSVEKALAHEQVARASLDLANTEYQRVLNLFNNNAISKQELDTALANRSIKRAEHLSAQTMLKQERQLLSDSKIRATYNGIVGVSNVQPGDLIQAQSTVLARLTKMDPLWVEVGVSETQYKALFGDDKANGALAFTVAGKAFEAPITFQASEVDPTLGTITLRAEFANADHAVTPGMFVQVSVIGKMRNGVVKVPQRAVMNGTDGQYVYVMSEGTAQIRPVVASEWDAGFWVIEKGLSTGDQVISSGHMKLRPGAQVILKPAEAQQAGVSR